MKSKLHRFDVYRFQLIPQDRHFQGLLFGNIKSVADLIAHKNELIDPYLLGMKIIKGPRSHVIARLDASIEKFYLYRFAVNRSITVETKDFNEKDVENWPSFWVGVWNDPEEQYILIEQRRDAFNNTQTVKDGLVTTLSNLLKNVQLTIAIEPLFEKEEFWKLIGKYSGKISEIKFELVTPNMANISRSMKDDLKEFAMRHNASKTQIGLTASPDASLLIEPSDQQIKGLVEYSSLGGGDITLTVKGQRRKIKTSSTIRSIDIEDVKITGRTADDIVKVLKGLLD